MGRRRQRGREVRTSVAVPPPREAFVPNDRVAPIGTLEAVWLAALVTVPVAVNPFASTGRFDTEKALLLRAWGLMAALCLLYRGVLRAARAARRWTAARRANAPGDAALRGEAEDPARAVLGWLLAGAVAAALSAGFALSSGAAWRGGVGRGGGVLTQWACAALCAAVAVDCRSRIQVHRAVLAVVLGSVLPTVVGWMQVAGYPLFVSGVLPENRPWGPFGNAIALGSYLAGVLPASAYVLWRARRGRRVLPGVLLIAQLALLVRSAARGPMLGLVAAAALAALLVARRRGWRNAATAGAFATVALLGIFLGGIQLVARSELVRQYTRTGMLTRFNTVEVRVQLYRAMTARMVDVRPLELPSGMVDRHGPLRPWIGYGPECLAEPLLSRVTARFEVAEGYDHIPDSTHSLLMDLLGGGGVVGLLLHLGFVVALVRVARRALGMRTESRRRWLCGSSLAVATSGGVVVMVGLWGAFAWALGLLAGFYVGLLLALAILLVGERQASAIPRPGWIDAAALAAGASVFGLWVEAQFGIPLVSSQMLFYVGGGLLVALAQLQAGPPAESPEGEGGDDGRGPWCGVAMVAALALLLVSGVDNGVGATDALAVVARAARGSGFGWLLAAGVVAAGWALPRGRSRLAVAAVFGGALYVLWHAETLAGLRSGSLRSVSEIVAWGERMQQAAGLRMVPFLLLPALLALRPWRGFARRILLGVVAFAGVGALLWPEIRHDILMTTATRTVELGEPKAGLQVFERTVGRDLACPHAAHHASQARLIAARAVPLPREGAAPASAAALWGPTLQWARRATEFRPLYAPHHTELGGVLDNAARAETNAVQRQRLALAADGAFGTAVALAPGMTAHRRRQAGLRYTVLGDAEGAKELLEEMLAVDPQNPVALSMLSKWKRREGDAAVSAAAKEQAYGAALLMAERCLESPTVNANRVDVSSTRRDLSELQAWFRAQGAPVPTLPRPSAPAVAYVAPKLPQPADRVVLRQLALRGGLALVLALALTPLLRRVARMTGFVDAPAARKLHAAPTPLLGGVAIAVSVLVACLGFPGRVVPAPLNAVLGVAACLGLVGLWDDRRPLPWWLKLAAQGVAAAALYAVNVRVQLAWLPTWANVGLTLMWLVGITNAVNFLDNMNGLSAGLSALSAVAVVVLGILNEGWEVAAVAVAVAGACFGFLRYNHHWHATIFMGDAGSLFLGCVLASLTLLLRFPANHNWVTWLCPVLLLAVPVFDMTHVCLARLRCGKNPFSTPGKDHTSHLLARMGFERHGAVLAIHFAVVGCAVAAGLVAYASTLVAYGLAGAVFAFAVFLLTYFELRFGRGGTDADAG